jgi:hypothetical protein
VAIFPNSYLVPSGQGLFPEYWKYEKQIHMGLKYPSKVMINPFSIECFISKAADVLSLNREFKISQIR